MKLLVIGSGAVGGVVAGLLAKKGFEVDLACKTSDISNHINTDGLIFKVKKRRYIHFVPAYAGVSDTPGDYDYVFLTTKSFDVEEPTKQVLDKLSPKGLIVSFQDGYCESKLASIAGSEKIVGAVIGWGASVNQQGIPVLTATGEMIVGKLDGKDDPRLDNLSYILSAIGPTYAVKNINEHIFSKLVINSGVTTLGAISGQKIGALVTNKRMRNIFIQLVREAITVANRLNFEIPDFSGKINYYQLVKGKNVFHRLRRHFILQYVGIRYRKIKSSGLQSLERGEKTEVDSLNGYIINKGHELGIDLPINELLLKMVHEIERGEREISPKNFNHPLFR